MKLATLKNNTPDGQLIVVSKDLQYAVDATAIAPNLRTAIEQWQAVSPDLEKLYQALNQGQLDNTFTFDPKACGAPMPRAPQWLDGSAFLNHGRLMDQAFNSEPIADFETIPVMYQGASDDFRGPTDDMEMPDEALGIDFEGEFGAIVDQVPMSSTPEQCQEKILLFVQINDWSLRNPGPREMKTGFGFIQAKPSSSFAPVAVTPDELGEAWLDGRVHMTLQIKMNGDRIGEPNGREMHYTFGQLIAHAARTRKLTAGTILGSGTVSNKSRDAGSACLAERRVIEKIDLGEIKTDFMHYGERVRMEAFFEDGSPGPFGVIDQQVVQYRNEE
jgi:fumarylacetoacetate (FAA) hydrolase